MTRFPIYALWSHPRSMSTVFERVMMERGDLQTVFEPFAYMYYVGEGHKVPHLTADPERPRSYEDIVLSIRRAAENQPVFIKDMSYYIVDRLSTDAGFFGSILNSFLVRHPARSIASYARMQSDFTLLEVGLESQYHHLEWILARDPAWSPVIIDADDLQRNPVLVMYRYCESLGLGFFPQSLTWAPGLPSEWTDWAPWHATVEASAGLEPRTPRKLEESLAFVMADPRLRQLYEHHLPFYEKLRAFRLDIADCVDTADNES